MTGSYSHYLIRKSTALNTELENPAGVYRMSWSLTLALGMSPYTPLCPLHQLVCTGQALLCFSVHAMASCGTGPGAWLWHTGWMLCEQWYHRTADHGRSWFVSEGSGWCVLRVLCLSVGSVLVTPLWLPGGPSSCLQFLSKVWLQRKTLKLSFFDLALRRERQKQHSCHLPIF